MCVFVCVCVAHTEDESTCALKLESVGQLVLWQQENMQPNWQFVSQAWRLWSLPLNCLPAKLYVILLCTTRRIRNVLSNYFNAPAPQQLSIEANIFVKERRAASDSF